MVYFTDKNLYTIYYNIKYMIVNARVGVALGKDLSFGVRLSLVTFLTYGKV